MYLLISLLLYSLFHFNLFYSYSYYDYDLFIFSIFLFFNDFFFKFLIIILFLSIYLCYFIYLSESFLIIGPLVFYITFLSNFQQLLVCTIWIVTTYWFFIKSPEDWGRPVRPKYRKTQVAFLFTVFYLCLTFWQLLLFRATFFVLSNFFAFWAISLVIF